MKELGPCYILIKACDCEGSCVQQEGLLKSTEGLILTLPLSQSRIREATLTYPSMPLILFET